MDNRPISHHNTYNGGASYQSIPTGHAPASGQSSGHYTTPSEYSSSSTVQPLQSIYMVNTNAAPQQQPQQHQQQQQQQQRQPYGMHTPMQLQSQAVNHAPMPPLQSQSMAQPYPQQALSLQGGGYVAPALNWQVCEALFHCAVGRPSSISLYVGDGRVSMGPEAMGCLMKTKDLSLVFTVPAVAALREELLRPTLLSSSSSARESGETDQHRELYRDQRFLRSVYVRELQRRMHEAAFATPAHSLSLAQGTQHTVPNLLLSLLPPHSRVRSRKSGYKDNRYWEREERVRDAKKKGKRTKQSEFFKALLGHQESFLKYHKDVRNELGKTAKAVRSALELQQNKAKREEMRLELQRLQALKANDMATYLQMVSQSKNDRLQFLISQTDSYLANINQKIQEQRDNQQVKQPDGSVQKEDGTEGGSEMDVSPSNSSNNEPPKKAEDRNDSMALSAKVSQASKDYYYSTHRVSETVHQPLMLQGGALKEYQLQGLQWMVSLHNNKLNGILADEMGLGKTIQTIALICYIVEVKKKQGPYLCVVPLSTLSNWINEFAKWAPDLIVVEYKGPKEARKEIRKQKLLLGGTSLGAERGHASQRFHVLVTTYEYVIRDKSQLKRFPWEYIIVDEGHRMKNADSLLARILGCDYHSRYRLLLTGTPLQNNLPELWALLNFLLPNIFGSSESFEEWFNKPFAQFRQRGALSSSHPLHESNAETNRLTQEEQLLVVQRLHEVLRPFVLRRVKREVQDQLPEKSETVLRCPLSAWQKQLYQAIISKGFASSQQGTTAAGSQGAAGGLSNTIMQLRKVCSHPYLFLKEYVLDNEIVRSSGKFLLLERMLFKLKAAGHRVLIFSQMVETLKLLEDYLSFRGFSYLTLHGNVSAEDREQRIFAFNEANSPYFVFLLSTRAGGLGVNLATADTVIIFDSDWNPMADAQAQDRAHRIGQKNKVSVFRLQTNTSVEEKILQTANEKKSLTGLVVDAAEFGVDAMQQDKTQNRAMMEMLLNELKAVAERARDLDDDEEREDEQGREKMKDDDNDDLGLEELNELLASAPGEEELYREMDERERAREKACPDDAISPMPRWLGPHCWMPRFATILGETESERLTVSFSQSQSAKTDVFQESATPGHARGRVKERKNYAEDALLGISDSENERENEGESVRRSSLIIGENTLTIRMSMSSQKKSSSAVTPAKTPSKRGRKGVSALPPLIQSIVKSIQEIEKLPCAALFKEKPSVKLYPSYCTIVATPISLKEVLQKLKGGEYAFFEEIESDLALMSDNARVFNGEASFVFTHAEQVRAEFYARTLSVRREHGLQTLWEKTHGGEAAHPPMPADSSLIYAQTDRQRFCADISFDVEETAPSAKKAKH